MLATDIEASRRAHRAALLDRLAAHPWAVGVRHRVVAIARAQEGGQDLRQPLQALVMYAARISGAANSTLPVNMSDVESARLTGFQRAATQLGIVLGRLAGGEPVDVGQLHGVLSGLEDALQELLLAFGREPNPAHAVIDLE